MLTERLRRRRLCRCGMGHLEKFIAFVAVTGLVLAVTLVWFLTYLHGLQP